MSMKRREELKEVLIILKSDGYSLKDGKKPTKTIDLFVNSGRIPKKVDIESTLERFHPNSFNGDGIGSLER